MKVKSEKLRNVSFCTVFALALAVSLCGGCLNVTAHIKGTVRGSYTGSKCNVELMSLSMNYADGIVLMLPLAVDLPFEAVADTVTLPYDLTKEQ